MDKQQEQQNILRIKRTRGYVPLFLMLSVVLLALSIYCIIYAYSAKLGGGAAAAFYAAGAIGTLFFAYSVFDYLFQTISPKNALLISDEGFIDLTMGGTGAGFVDWSNIKNAEIASSGNGRILKIELSDSEAVIEKAPRSAQRAMRAALENGDSCIIIRQMDVAVKLKEILDVFTAHMTDAKELADQRAAEAENSKTRVVTDDDVKNMCRAQSAREDIPEAVSTDTTALPDISAEAAVKEAPAHPEEEAAAEPEKAPVEPKEAPVETEKQASYDKRDIDVLLAKLSEDLKSNTKTMSDEERKRLTDELTDMLGKMKNEKHNAE